MTIRFQCPSCNSIRTIHDRMAGKEVHCPDCNVTVVVPDPAKIVQQLPSVIPIQPIQVQPIKTELIATATPAASSALVSPKARQLRSQFDRLEGTDDDAVLDEGESVVDTTKKRIARPSKRSKPTVEDDEAEVESFSFPDRQLPTDDMDMTPMVDVTFLLLIFFMITASFSAEKAIQQKAAMAEAASSQPQPENDQDTIKILIDEFNAYTVIFPDGDEREATSKQELLSVLGMAELDGASEDASNMMIEAHEDSIHASVVNALDAGREKGFSKFDVKVVEGFD